MKKEMEPGCTVSTTNSWKIAESRREFVGKDHSVVVSSEKKESYAAEDVDEDTCEEKKKTNENNESFWPMDLLRLNKGILKTEGNSAKKMNEEEQAKAKKKTSKKPNAPPLGESSNQNNNDNVGFVTSFFPSLNVSAKKKSTLNSKKKTLLRRCNRRPALWATMSYTQLRSPLHGQTNPETKTKITSQTMKPKISIMTTNRYQHLP